MVDRIEPGPKTKANANPQPREWRGVHVPLQRNEQADALIRELPALAEIGINALVAEIDYNYAYASHAELREEKPIDSQHARELARACHKHGVRLIPQFQCLGHQSWGEKTFALLRRYPEYDETPGQYPNNAGIYCRSWCPQEPAVLRLIFDLFDELLEVFQADALHVGMDEVFFIASEHCPRCRGAGPSELFARAVLDYYGHLHSRGVQMLMWGDRLLDDKVMGYGEWEAAANGTHDAIAQIPRDIVICDWHYELRESYPSIPFFLEQGFGVWPSGWREPAAVEALVDYALKHRGERIVGFLSTTWQAVQPGELAGWPPITAAIRRLSGPRGSPSSG